MGMGLLWGLVKACEEKGRGFSGACMPCAGIASSENLHSSSK